MRWTRDMIGRALDAINSKQRAYQLTFGSPAGNQVLIDLAEFCRAAETCYDDDPRKHAVLEGRREVFLRIARHCNLTSEQIFKLYTGINIQANGDIR